MLFGHLSDTAATGFAVAAALAAGSTTAKAGSARDCLSAPIDIRPITYNFRYSTSVTPEDGMDLTSAIRSKVLSQSVGCPLSLSKRSFRYFVIRTS
jgi:hypothetical protein